MGFLSNFKKNIQDAKKAGFRELTISNKIMKKIGKAKVKIKGNVLRKENLELFRNVKLLWRCHCYLISIRPDEDETAISL
mgnify:CR=1 FL=1